MTDDSPLGMDPVPAQLLATLAPDEVDLAIDVLWLHGTNGIEERSTEETVELLAGFEDRATADAAATRLASRVAPIRLEVRLVRDDAYLDVWRESAEPITIGRITLWPTWLGHEPPDEIDRITLSLDPGRAFGLGNHPTTRHVIAQLQETVSGGERVLDVGCGSGVLAIAALRLGAAEAVGIDIDPEALRASLHNAEQNQVADRLRLSAEPLGPPTDGATASGDTAEPYEIVVANIGAAALIELAPAIRSRCGPTTTLVLSGILDEQAEAVRLTYLTNDGFWATTRAVSTNGWTTLTLMADKGQ